MLKSKNGFTLTELLVTICIVVLIGALAIPTFTSTRTDTKAVACEFNQSSVERSYKTHLLIGDGFTLQDVLDYEFSGPNDRCPEGGKYSVQNISATYEVHIKCDFHGSERYTFDFGVSNPETVKGNMSSLISGMQGFAESLKQDGYSPVKVGTNGVFVVDPAGKQTLYKQPGNTSSDSLLLASAIKSFFGEESNVLASGATNFRVALDKDQNVISVSYKIKADGYIAYADGSVYKLDGCYFTSSAEFNNTTPIMTAIYDKTALDRLPGKSQQL